MRQRTDSRQRVRPLADQQKEGRERALFQYNLLLLRLLPKASGHVRQPSPEAKALRRCSFFPKGLIDSRIGTLHSYSRRSSYVLYIIRTKGGHYSEGKGELKSSCTTRALNTAAAIIQNCAMVLQSRKISKKKKLRMLSRSSISDLPLKLGFATMAHNREAQFKGGILSRKSRLVSVVVR